MKRRILIGNEDATYEFFIDGNFLTKITKKVGNSAFARDVEFEYVPREVKVELAKKLSEE